MLSDSPKGRGRVCFAKQVLFVHRFESYKFEIFAPHVDLRERVKVAETWLSSSFGYPGHLAPKSFHPGYLALLYNKEYYI